MNDEAEIERLQLPPVVFQAEGRLSALLGVSIDEAVVGLELRAQFLGLSLVETADGLMREQRSRAAPRPEIDKASIATLRQHLDGSGSPLDHLR